MSRCGSSLSLSSFRGTIDDHRNAGYVRGTQPTDFVEPVGQKPTRARRGQSGQEGDGPPGGPCRASSPQGPRPGDKACSHIVRRQSRCRKGERWNEGEFAGPLSHGRRSPGWPPPSLLCPSSQTRHSPRPGRGDPTAVAPAHRRAVPNWCKPGSRRSCAGMAAVDLCAEAAAAGPGLFREVPAAGLVFWVPRRHRQPIRYRMTRKALLVLGMHRSGTSALTGLLVQLGATAPRTLIRATRTIRTGYLGIAFLQQIPHTCVADCRVILGCMDASRPRATWFATRH